MGMEGRKDQNLFELDSHEYLSPKSLKEDFSVFNQYEKENPSIFHDCLNIFMG